MDITQNAIIQNIAQLHYTSKNRPLSPQEAKELELCLDWVVNKTLARAALSNLSLLASMTNDITWQHEICSSIDKLKEGGEYV